MVQKNMSLKKIWVWKSESGDIQVMQTYAIWNVVADAKFVEV